MQGNIPGDGYSVSLLDPEPFITDHDQLDVETYSRQDGKKKPYPFPGKLFLMQKLIIVAKYLSIRVQHALAKLISL